MTTDKRGDPPRTPDPALSDAFDNTTERQSPDAELLQLGREFDDALAEYERFDRTVSVGAMQADMDALEERRGELIDAYCKIAERMADLTPRTLEGLAMAEGCFAIPAPTFGRTIPTSATNGKPGLSPLSLTRRSGWRALSAPILLRLAAMLRSSLLGNASEKRLRRGKQPSAAPTTTARRGIRRSSTPSVSRANCAIRFGALRPIPCPAFG